jgi:anti-sigma factor RsiW
MTKIEHDFEWNDRLQDLVDGDLSPEEHAAIEAHVESCAVCANQLAALRALDAELREATPRLALDAAFDERLFARIDSADEARLAKERQRLKDELESDLANLTREWRRTLAIIVPSVLAGIALAFGLAEYFGTAEWMQSLTAQSAGEIGTANAAYLHIVLTSAFGAAVGYTVARWLAPEPG